MYVLQRLWMWMWLWLWFYKEHAVFMHTYVNKEAIVSVCGVCV